MAIFTPEDGLVTEGDHLEFEIEEVTDDELVFISIPGGYVRFSIEETEKLISHLQKIIADKRIKDGADHRMLAAQEIIDVCKRHSVSVISSASHDDDVVIIKHPFDSNEALGVCFPSEIDPSKSIEEKNLEEWWGA